MKVSIGPYEDGDQKIDIEIEEHDTWSMDLTLAHIIVPMLKQLKETKHGAPSSLPEFQMISYQLSGGRQMCFDFYEAGNDTAWDAGHTHWDEIMDKMIWSFEQVLVDWEDQYWTVKPKLDLDAMLKQEDEDSEVNTHPLLWDEHGVCDWVGMDNHRKKMQEGFDLFGKYFCDLWD